MSSTRKKVLVVEDDDAIRRGLVDSLRFAGFDVIEAADGHLARAPMLGSSIDLCLLDVMLPGPDGFQLLQELRRSRPRLPVIMLTARGAEEDRVRGLREGADDYVVKPFSSTELIARVEAVLRRSAERPQDVKQLRIEQTVVQMERSQIDREDQEPRQLTEREAGVLRYLAVCRDRAISREELLQHVWGLDPRGIETRTVDMHIARLRDKLGKGKSGAEFIVTVRAKGYMLGESVEVVQA
ncbi:MAG: DNA-binding response OmpR family regulator [Planctomycetota bacterium]|jgi:DNA-binding response OmpR family regulator